MKKLDLTVGPIYPNLLKMALPLMLANLMQTIFNLSDAYWLGKLGSGAKEAVSAVGIAFPLIFTLTSFGIGFVVACSSLISQYKGAINLHEVKNVIGQFALLLFLFSLFVLGFSLIFLSDILRLMQTPIEVFPLAKSYLTFIIWSSFFQFIVIVYQGVMQGMGNTLNPMVIQLISVGFNILLSPLLIFGVGIFPRLEINGAGLANLVSRCFAAILALYFFLKKEKLYVPTWQNLKPNFPLLKKILAIGIPSSIAQSITSFGFLFLQGFVNSYGTVVISVYSLGNRMVNFFTMPAMGLSSALASMIGQNLGAKRIDRAIASYRAALTLTSIFMGIGCVVIYMFGAELIRFFIDDPQIVADGARMFKVSSFSSFIFGIMFVYTGVFNGSGYTGAVMKFNISRLWLVRIPLTYILSGAILNFSVFKNSWLAPLIEVISSPLKEHPYDSLWWSMLVGNLFALIWAYKIFKEDKWKEGRIYR